MTRTEAIDKLYDEFQECLNIVKEIDNEPYWHTEEPTEEGEYLCVVKKITWNSKEVTETQIVIWCDEFYINGFPVDRTSIFAWHKIPPYEEQI